MTAAASPLANGSCTFCFVSLIRPNGKVPTRLTPYQLLTLPLTARSNCKHYKVKVWFTKTPKEQKCFHLSTLSHCFTPFLLFVAFIIPLTTLKSLHPTRAVRRLFNRSRYQNTSKASMDVPNTDPEPLALTARRVHGRQVSHTSRLTTSQCSVWPQ